MLFPTSQAQQCSSAAFLLDPDQYPNGLLRSAMRVLLCAVQAVGSNGYASAFPRPVGSPASFVPALRNPARLPFSQRASLPPRAQIGPAMRVQCAMFACDVRTPLACYMPPQPAPPLAPAPLTPPQVRARTHTRTNTNTQHTTTCTHRHRHRRRAASSNGGYASALCPPRGYLHRRVNVRDRAGLGAE